MKLQVQKDLQLSQMRLSHLSSYLAQTRPENRKKSSKNSKFLEAKRKQPHKLQVVYEKQKVSQINKQFIKKIKLLIPHSSVPSQLLAFRKQSTNFFDFLVLRFEQLQGFKIGLKWHLLWKFLILLKVIIVLVVSSFLIAFPKGEHVTNFLRIIQFSIIASLVDIGMNFTFQKFQNNKNIKKLLNIGKQYVKNDFVIDILAAFMSTLMRATVDYITISLLIILTLVKLWRSFNRIEVLEHIYIINVFHEKYYSIGRVIFFNFMIAHFIAIIALLMANVNEDVNWKVKKQIQQADWFEQYIWAFYWAVNIMLTVGFGDISASNKQQALVLIFVQTFSCIMLAYNINVVGSILTDIKQKQRQRKNQLRILLKQSQQNQIQHEIVSDAINYVDQSFKIKQKFCYEQHDAIIQNLPENLQSQYIRQTNKKMLLQLPLSNLFSRKSIMKIALQINRKLAHPEQIIWKKGQPVRIVILNKGKLGLVLRRDNSILNGQIIRNIQIVSKQSKLLYMNFFRNQKFLCDIKSINYSITYYLQNQDLIEALSQKNTDYEIFCQIRDKSEFRLQSGQIYNCELCLNDKHDQFNCPKMHLILPNGYIIYKHLFSRKNNTNERIYLNRAQVGRRFLKKTKLIKNESQLFMSENFGSLKQTNNSIQQEGILFSNKTTSIRSNMPLSNVFKDMDIQRLNTFLVAKMNEQELCMGFWSLECDVGHNFNSYFRNQNPEYINKQNTPHCFYKKISRTNSASFNEHF